MGLGQFDKSYELSKSLIIRDNAKLIPDEVLIETLSVLLRSALTDIQKQKANELYLNKENQIEEKIDDYNEFTILELAKCYSYVSQYYRGLESSIEDAPESPMANALLARVYLSRGQSEEAQKALQVAVKSAPRAADETRVTGILGTGP